MTGLRRRIASWLGSPRLAAGLAIVLIFLILGFVLPAFAPADPRVWYTVPRNRPPSLVHLLGTTSLGQDVFWLLTWALRDSLLLGLAVGFFSTLVGVAAGLTAGYRGGLVDRALSFLMDAFLCIPSLPVLVLLAALLNGSASLPLICIILVLFNWPFPARQIRAVALSMREREFVNVAWFSGESGPRILYRYIFPYIATWSAANFINTVLVGISLETSLAVIGLSSAQQATLGTMIYWAVKYQALLARRYVWIGAPVVAVVAMFIGLFLVSSGLAARSTLRRAG
jgi:peptide/nickel transport system permease protein